MSIDLDNLEMTYKKIYEVSVQIAQLIDRQIYTELVTFMSKKEQLFKEAGNLIEKVKAKNEDTSRLVEICTKIQKQEQENIVALSMVRDEIKKELGKTAKSSKLISAYSNAELKQGNILDYRQ
ncbi:MAG: hypothetical protein V8R83_01555 [Candidatus Gastranaerophilaceae bacterium]|jgi:hypothetical protein|uniref:Flagellar protein FliT n=1 Tax=Candidatus Limenecus avicola TaxID=2840847 RepID=A0A9D1N004_9CLOT|nr:hypothetical protein [Clostridium sp.]CDC21653.1 unknown [Clostridium sp. CAG:306]HIU92287.1 hypothetical protein [Candidatus Limenecus avicola]